MKTTQQISNNYFFSGKKLDDGKGLGGIGRLTLQRINTIQNFYGLVLRDKNSNAEEMSRATHAILKHYSDLPLESRHGDCPTGQSSWCSYNRDIATKETSHRPIKNPLPVAVVKAIQPIFEKLGDPTFLAGCEGALTQNVNESLHHAIWSLAPKDQYTSASETSLAIKLGTIIFNDGLAPLLKSLLPMIGMQVGNASEAAWIALDTLRAENKKYKDSDKTKTSRKRLKRIKTKKQDAFVHEEGIQYKSQGFYAPPSKCKSTKNARKKNTTAKNKT